MGWLWAGGRRVLAVAGIAAAALYLCASAAACTGTAAQQITRGTRLVAADEQAAGGQTSTAVPGAVDTRAVLARAKAHCSAAPFAYAVAVAATHAQTVGMHVAVGAVRLVAVRQASGVVWRFDAAGSLARWARTHGRARVPGELLGLASGSRTRRLVWPLDPTQPSFTLAQQLAVASQLVAYRQNTLAAATLVPLDRGTWGVVAAGTWATLAQQRSLATKVAHLAAASASTALRTRAASLAAELHTPPSATYVHVPVTSFYPAPRDGTLDSESVSVRVGKPVQVGLSVYDAAGTRVYAAASRTTPGIWTGTWDGSNGTGAHTALDPGSYRYVVLVTDLAGNHVMLPGIGSFTIAHDSTPPIVDAGTLTTQSTTLRRSFHASWHVTEPLSPKITLEYVLRSSTTHVAIVVPDPSLAGAETTSYKLPNGTYHVWLRVVDGSGNVTSKALPDITLR